MRRTICILAFLSVLRLAEAEPAPTKIAAQPISYARPIPASILQRMPRGAKTCFYGAVRLSATSSPLLIHLYNPSPRQKAGGYFKPYRLGLNLFTPNARQKGRRKTFQLLNSSDVVYRTVLEKPSKFAAQLLWLDPKAKSIPLLKFDCFDPDGSEGLIGDNVLVVFAGGIKKKPVVQSLEYGSWRANDSIGQNTTFDTVDEKGLLELHTTLSLASDEPRPKWTLRWNQKEFYSVGGPLKDTAFNGLPYP